MKKQTFFLVLLVIGTLLALGIAVTAGGGNAFSDWLAAMHGAPRH